MLFGRPWLAVDRTDRNRIKVGAEKTSTSNTTECACMITCIHLHACGQSSTAEAMLVVVSSTVVAAALLLPKPNWHYLPLQQ